MLPRARTGTAYIGIFLDLLTRHSEVNQNQKASQDNPHEYSDWQKPEVRFWLRHYTCSLDRQRIGRRVVNGYEQRAVKLAEMFCVGKE